MLLIPSAVFLKKVFRSILKTAGSVWVELPVGVVTAGSDADGLLKTFIRVFAVAMI